MNEYEISELEGKELHCETCGRHISTHEYIEFDGECEYCFSNSIKI